MIKCKILTELKEKNHLQVKEKTTKTEFHYQEHTTEHSLTYLNLRIKTGISCK